MGWATTYLRILEEKGIVQFRPKGNSMVGKINSGDLCTVEKVDKSILKEGDIVLCKVKGNEYLHLISAIKTEKLVNFIRFLIIKAL